MEKSNSILIQQNEPLPEIQQGQPVEKTSWPLAPANSALRPAPLGVAGFGLR